MRCDKNSKYIRFSKEKNIDDLCLEYVGIDWFLSLYIYNLRKF